MHDSDLKFPISFMVGIGLITIIHVFSINHQMDLNKEAIVTLLKSQIETRELITRFDDTISDFVYVRERLEMEDPENYDKVRVNGLYWPEPKNYYCVWVNGRNDSSIHRTEIHEQCHALVDLDWKHFCGY